LYALSGGSGRSRNHGNLEDEAGRGVGSVSYEAEAIQGGGKGDPLKFSERKVASPLGWRVAEREQLFVRVKSTSPGGKKNLTNRSNSYEKAVLPAVRIGRGCPGRDPRKRGGGGGGGGLFRELWTGKSWIPDGRISRRMGHSDKGEEMSG